VAILGFMLLIAPANVSRVQVRHAISACWKSYAHLLHSLQIRPGRREKRIAPAPKATKDTLWRAEKKMESRITAKRKSPGMLAPHGRVT